jgi:tripartite-type tricarboxylate transporter receptor subunit TctC
MFASRVIAAALLATGLLATSQPSWAQSFPNRPVRLIVAFAAGGTGDIVARVIADKLGPALGQTVVVDNRPGASGAIGTQAVIASPPDGHTLLLGQTGEIAINPHWGKSAGYDPDKDLVPVALATVVPLALVIPGKAAYSTLPDMLKSAATRPLTFASAGLATPGHFAGEVLKLRTKSDINHVPYKGAGPALNDLLGGHVDMFFSGFPAAMPHVKAASLKLLAVSSGRRSDAAPDTPTVAEAAGIPGFDITLWQGLFAPRGTPSDVVARLNAEINRILAEPEVKQKLLDAGADVSPMALDQFAAFVKQEGAKFQGIIKDANLTP